MVVGDLGVPQECCGGTVVSWRSVVDPGCGARVFQECDTDPCSGVLESRRESCPGRILNMGLLNGSLNDVWGLGRPRSGAGHTRGDHVNIRRYGLWSLGGSDGRGWLEPR